MHRKQMILLSVLLMFLSGCSRTNDWRTASRESAGIAPNPEITQEAVVQVYAADAWGWRGLFAIHTWLATKRTGEKNYTVYDVVGWRQRHGQPVVGIRQDIPDRYWYGARPHILADRRGEGVDQLIDAIDAAARAYPWPETYSVFPGPNSNTFIAWIAREVPAIGLRLPFRAIGSGYVN